MLGGVAAGYLALPAACLACGIAARALVIDPGVPLPPRSAAPALLPALILLGPLLEELLYRERLLGALERTAGRSAAVLGSSAAFALPHAEPRVALASFLTGLVLAAVWLRARSLALCVGLHAGLNLAVQVGGAPPVRLALPALAGAAASGVVLFWSLRGGPR